MVFQQVNLGVFLVFAEAAGCFLVDGCLGCNSSCRGERQREAESEWLCIPLSEPVEFGAAYCRGVLGIVDPPVPGRPRLAGGPKVLLRAAPRTEKAKGKGKRETGPLCAGCVYRTITQALSFVAAHIRRLSMTCGR